MALPFKFFRTLLSAGEFKTQSLLDTIRTRMTKNYDIEPRSPRHPNL